MNGDEFGHVAREAPLQPPALEEAFGRLGPTHHERYAGQVSAKSARQRSAGLVLIHAHEPQRARLRTRRRRGLQQVSPLLRNEPPPIVALGIGCGRIAGQKSARLLGHPAKPVLPRRVGGLVTRVRVLIAHARQSTASLRRLGDLDQLDIDTTRPQLRHGERGKRLAPLPRGASGVHDRHAVGAHDLGRASGRRSPAPQRETSAAAAPADPAPHRRRAPSPPPRRPPRSRAAAVRPTRRCPAVHVAGHRVHRRERRQPVEHRRVGHIAAVQHDVAPLEEGIELCRQLAAKAGNVRVGQDQHRRGHGSAPYAEAQDGCVARPLAAEWFEVDTTQPRRRERDPLASSTGNMYTRTSSTRPRSRHWAATSRRGSRGSCRWRLQRRRDRLIDVAAEDGDAGRRGLRRAVGEQEERPGNG